MYKIKRKIHLDKIIKLMKKDYPLFYKLKDYGIYYHLTKKELKYVLSEIFGQPVKKYRNQIINENNGREIYGEYSGGIWYKREYDEYGNQIYFEGSSDTWSKWEYDKDGNIIYEDHSDPIRYKFVNDFLEKNKDLIENNKKKNIPR